MKFKLNDRDHQPEIKTINGKKCVTIYYGKVLPIAIDVPLELKNGNVDLNKFTQSVKDAVDASETKLNQDSNYRKLSEWIEKFDEQTITDPLIKRFATDKKLNFTCEKKDNGKVILKGVVTDKGTVPYISSEINSTSMIKDWKFDNELFNEQLYNCFHKDAATYLNNYYIDKLNSNVVLASDSEDANELQRNIALCDEYLDAEKKLNKKGDLDSSMGTITTRKTELTDKKEYVEDKTQLDRMVTAFENAGKGKRQWEEINAKVIALRSYMKVTTEVDSDWLITKITLSPRRTWTDWFKTAEQKREYNDAVQNMARTLRTIDRAIQVEITQLR